ncbi:MAG TPA: OmpA family protein [Vicinamibacterales bacterium]|nr:OmpA family protein [Vicinamibacterales bacterium]
MAAADDDDGIGSLRAILLAPEQRQLEELQVRLDDRDRRAHDIGEVLPLVLREHAHDPQLARALTPPLEEAITASVKRNPKPLADALFPVMGPAIRKAVSASLASMVESFNRTLEQAFSRRSIRWRLEAMRTGKSFAEVVMLKTLLYRVEQAFLIDRRSGLLLQHVQAGSGVVQDADMVSGMLTAIRDFVQDSFKVSETDSLEALKVGELSVWIEPGPQAIVAAVIRGSAPRDFRPTLQDAVETIHLQFGDLLERFEGDASTLEPARPTLEACLQQQYRAEERKPRTTAAWAFAVVVALVLSAWTGLAWRSQARDQRYLDALRAEPGLTVVSSERRGGKLVVTGLRDPLAKDPLAVATAAGIDAAGIDGRWTAYQALEPSLVLARATRILQPPAGVTLSLADGVLSFTGAAPGAWIAEARRTAPLIAGVSAFDPLLAMIAIIESPSLLFHKGTPILVPGQDAEVQRLAETLRDFDARAAAAGQRFAIEIVGHTDAEGPDETNLPLSKARADAVRDAIAPKPFTNVTITTNGVGSREPAVGPRDSPSSLGAGQNEADNQRNRRVTLRVSRLTGGPR